jgi:hypothetical protein
MTDKSEAIARTRKCQSSQLKAGWTQKENLENLHGQGGGRALGVADQKNPTNQNEFLPELSFSKAGAPLRGN